MSFGMDPEVTKYFKKIISSFSVGLLWMLMAATFGLYFKLAIIEERVKWYNILFYLFFLISFIALLYYYYKLWKD